eukprot:CAMPEP_0197693068 /NCGR_PEP_ID=MMETSP1338-20131121/111964_1 /TAXON_ID=43686 ORGANISM="Pelagodinium beii, Strain RCC1491" /NCGR_SAMPLE_ID=MMETSP1338 /ASSEMBLY_ACC=CAM_ASM_000754 /LENGTH=131 /DNA_ID=CAMNT_0043275777 /DNA_START=44 /DNA_END=436 /DNA_ORIENTATION=+
MASDASSRAAEASRKIEACRVAALAEKQRLQVGRSEAAAHVALASAAASASAAKAREALQIRQAEVTTARSGTLDAEKIETEEDFDVLSEPSSDLDGGSWWDDRAKVPLEISEGKVEQPSAVVQSIWTKSR